MQNELEVFGASTAKVPLEIDAVRDGGHERFGKVESPSRTLIGDDRADGISASIGGIVPRAVVIDGPV